MTSTRTVVSSSASKAASVSAEVLVVGLGKEGEGLRVVGSPATAAVAKKIVAAAEAVGFSGSQGAFTRIPSVAGVSASSIGLVGLGALGDKEAEAGGDATLETLRRAAGDAVRGLGGVETVAIALPAHTPRTLEAVAVGALLGAYKYNRYRKTPLAKTSHPVGAVTVLSAVPGKEAKAALARATAIGDAVARARDLVNDSPRDLYPETFAEEAQRLGKAQKKVKVTVFDDAFLEANGYGGLIGVGQGSQRPPRLVKVSYAAGKKAPHLALVGKGITFDSGGISIKPAAGMDEMKMDMAGAAAALNATLAAAELGLDVSVTAWLALAENMPSGSAQRPSDVISIYGGRTVEVLNTDAEGRLVMADAIVAAGEEQPDMIVDVATLTGAQMVALGTRVAGVMGSDDAREAVVEAAGAAGELVWGMPLPEELRAGLESSVADIANVSSGRYGGMLSAGVFLREFVPERADGQGSIPWAHIDIAGPAYNSGAGWGYTPAKGTGVAVRTLLALAEGLADGK